MNKFFLFLTPFFLNSLNAADLSQLARISKLERRIEALESNAGGKNKVVVKAEAALYRPETDCDKIQRAYYWSGWPSKEQALSNKHDTVETVLSEVPCDDGSSFIIFKSDSAEIAYAVKSDQTVKLK